jgi:hypothetical protein
MVLKKEGIHNGEQEVEFFWIELGAWQHNIEL